MMQFEITRRAGRECEPIRRRCVNCRARQYDPAIVRRYVFGAWAWWCQDAGACVQRRMSRSTAIPKPRLRLVAGPASPHRRPVRAAEPRSRPTRYEDQQVPMVIRGRTYNRTVVDIDLPPF